MHVKAVTAAKTFPTINIYLPIPSRYITPKSLAILKATLFLPVEIVVSKSFSRIPDLFGISLFESSIKDVSADKCHNYEVKLANSRAYVQMPNLISKGIFGRL